MTTNDEIFVEDGLSGDDITFAVPSQDGRIFWGDLTDFLPYRFGDASLTLIADDLVLGSDNRSRNEGFGPGPNSILGTGPLLILPFTNPDIELGVADPLAEGALSLTAGEISSFGAGFSSIVIGSPEKSAPVTLFGDVTLHDNATIYGGSFVGMGGTEAQVRTRSPSTRSTRR